MLPVCYLICNQTPPVGDAPSLMTYSDVETLFQCAAFYSCLPLVVAVAVALLRSRCPCPCHMCLSHVLVTCACHMCLSYVLACPV